MVWDTNTQNNTPQQQSMWTPNTYTPQTNLTNIAKQYQLQNPSTIGNIKIDNPIGDASQLRNDIYSGIEANVRQSRDDAWKRLQNTMSNAGLFRSGLSLANQQELERNAMDALAKGWGDASLKVAGLQSDIAKAQASIDLEVAKYGANIQNAWKEKNYDYLMQAVAKDQDTINQAQQFNIQIKNAYDELAFKWAAALLDKEIREYATNLDYLAKEGNTIAQFGTPAAKENWANLTPSIYNRIGLFQPTNSTTSM